MKHLTRIASVFSFILIILTTFPSAKADDFGNLFEQLLKPFPQKKQRGLRAEKRYENKKAVNDVIRLLHFLASPNPEKPARFSKWSHHSKWYLDDVLKDIDLAEEIDRKTRKLEHQFRKIFMKIRVYQAMNGAIWVSLGKSYKSLITDLDAFESKGQRFVGEFIRRTNQKQRQHMELIGHVTINASAGLNDMTETIELNQRKNETVRGAVIRFIAKNPLIGCSFQSLIEDRNLLLDALLNSYVIRLSQIVHHQRTSAIIFQDMAYEFKSAEQEMREAIRTFNQEGALVTLQAAEHLNVLYAHTRHLKDIRRTAGNDFVTTVRFFRKIPRMLRDINRLTSGLSRFRKNQKKLEGEVLKIQKISLASEREITRSRGDLEALGWKFEKMVTDQMSQIKKITEQRKIRTKNLEKMLKQEERQNRRNMAQISAREQRKIKEMVNRQYGAPVFE